MNDGAEVLTELTRYISRNVLEGRDEGLKPNSPLLAWGIINSLEITRLAGFVRSRFGIEIPSNRMVAEHFKDLDSITALVLELGHAQ